MICCITILSSIVLSFYSNYAQCPLCQGAPADPFHVLCYCPHPVAVSARTAALAKATTYIPTLPTLEKHIYCATPDPPAELTATYEELLALPPAGLSPWLSRATPHWQAQGPGPGRFIVK
jgi:hypothetical protein